MLRYLKNRYLDFNLGKKIIVLITLFITLVPTTLIATLSFIYYKVGIQSLFDEQISKAISQTVEIADRYLREHKDNIKLDVLFLAKDIEKNYDVLVDEPSLFITFLDKEVELRNLSETIVFQYDKIIAKNTFSFSYAFEKLPIDDLLIADGGDVVILNSKNEDKVQALVKLNYFANTYLIVGRYIDQSIIDYLKSSHGSAIKYHDIKSDLDKTQQRLKFSFFAASIILCVISLILGRKLALFITRPLNDLVNATEKLKSGDFSYYLPEKKGNDETAILTRAFNQMTTTLSEQHFKLIKFNEIINERRRYIEKILSEISSGVITLDNSNRIQLANQSAKKILKIPTIKKNAYLNDIFAELIEPVNAAITTKKDFTKSNLKITRSNANYYLFIRIGVIFSNELVETVIITFDDVTELLSAQRASAWGDVARRVAHEIKNPLTPISLAAERIRVKYKPENDTHVFEKYVDTIIKHADDIQKIVVEFVEFAKIPKPTLQKVDIIALCKEVLFSQKVTTPYISLIFMKTLSKQCYIYCDSTQISQVLINILKNSAESIDQKIATDKNFKGKIKLKTIVIDNKIIEISISDNGIGMNNSILGKVFEPYVTSKSKGTGLGLAIVKKILEDHGGTIDIAPNKGGVEVKFRLPLI